MRIFFFIKFKVAYKQICDIIQTQTFNLKRQQFQTKGHKYISSPERLEHAQK